MAGLQDISPSVSKRWVRSRVRAPTRAEAPAASQPAWPPPITMTSKPLMAGSIRASITRDNGSLADAEIPEDDIQQFLDIHPARDAADGAQRQPQILREQFRLICRRIQAVAQRCKRFSKRFAVPGPG